MRAEKTVAAGNFTVASADNQWSDGYSLNISVAESNLARLEAKYIEDLFGPDSVYTADKRLALTEILGGKFTQPIELFPMLMILLLLILAVENLLANKFYRKRK